MFNDYKVCIPKGDGVAWVELVIAQETWHIVNSYSDEDYTPLCLTAKEQVMAKKLARQIYNYIEKGSV